MKENQGKKYFVIKSKVGNEQEFIDFLKSYKYESKFCFYHKFGNDKFTFVRASASTETFQDLRSDFKNSKISKNLSFDIYSRKEFVAYCKNLLNPPDCDENLWLNGSQFFPEKMENR